MLEVSQLTELLKDRLGITALPPPMMGMPMAGMPAIGDAPAAGASASESAPEKTEFAVKLTGFDAASKIKVIKEVRAVTDLGLKEAKEMVSAKRMIAGADHFFMRSVGSMPAAVSCATEPRKKKRASPAQIRK